MTQNFEYYRLIHNNLGKCEFYSQKLVQITPTDELGLFG